MNNLRKIILVSIGLTAVVFGSWWSHIYSGQSRSDKVVSTASVDSVQTPKISGRAEIIGQRTRLSKSNKVLEELSRLKSRLTNIENSHNSQGSTVANEFIPEGNGSLENGDLTEQRIQAEQEMLEDTALHFATQLGQESRDPTWSSETELVITELLEGDNFQELQVVSTECQTSMCRIELDVDGDSSPSEIVHEMLMALPFETQSFFHNSEDENDTEHTVVYLARENYELSGMAK